MNPTKGKKRRLGGLNNMNGRKAKKLRRVVFGADDPNARKYARINKTKQVINVADKIRVSSKEGYLVTAKRALYQHLKQQFKRVPLDVIGRVVSEQIKAEDLTNENTQNGDGSGAQSKS